MTNDFEYENDFEEWEGDADLFYNEDWDGLVQLRKKRLELNPSDPNTQYRFGEALILNNKYDEAIEFLTPIYKDNPEFVDIIYLILDALFGQGKTEKDFNWIREPDILRLDNRTKDICFKILKNKRKRFPVTELYIQLILTDSYLTFNDNELAVYLKMDNNFDVDGDESFWDCKLNKTKMK